MRRAVREADSARGERAAADLLYESERALRSAESAREFARRAVALADERDLDAAQAALDAAQTAVRSAEAALRTAMDAAKQAAKQARRKK